MADMIRIEGLRDFQAALRKMDGESQKQIRLVLNDSIDIIATGARRLVPSRTGRARASIKTQSSQREARIKAGSAKAPYYPWLDFGGSVGRSNSINRPFLKSGRYIYPTYERRKPWFIERMQEGLDDLIKSAGMEPD